jgi:hypothetical protein
MKVVRLPPSEWPEDLRHPEVKGIAVGGCISRGTRLGRMNAHAHSSLGDHRGWICFRSAVTLAQRHTRLHELAHIVTREGHTKRWREFLLQIGGTLDEVPGISRDYHPRSRAGRRIVQTDVRSDGSVFVTYDSGAVTGYPPGSPGAVQRGGKADVTVTTEEFLAWGRR